MLVWFNQFFGKMKINEVFPLAAGKKLGSLISCVRLIGDLCCMFSDSLSHSTKFWHILSGPITICDISI